MIIGSAHSNLSRLWTAIHIMISTSHIPRHVEQSNAAGCCQVVNDPRSHSCMHASLWITYIRDFIRSVRTFIFLNPMILFLTLSVHFSASVQFSESKLQPSPSLDHHPSVPIDHSKICPIELQNSIISLVFLFYIPL